MNKVEKTFGGILIGAALVTIALIFAAVHSCGKIIEAEERHGDEFMKRCLASGRDSFSCEMYRDGRWEEERK
jgi:hypothetical protein